MVSLPVFSILIISISVLFTIPPADASPISCCFAYVTRKVPRQFVVDYVYTTKHCSIPGVIFTTMKGRMICANPQEEWVQKYVAELTEERV